MRSKYDSVVNWERLESLSDVCGIRIEDDILVTETSTKILTAKLPNKAEAIENMIAEIN